MCAVSSLQRGATILPSAIIPPEIPAQFHTPEAGLSCIIGGMAQGFSRYRIIVGLAFLLALLAGGAAAGTLTAQEEEPPPTPAATVKADNRQPAAASSYVVAFTTDRELLPDQTDPIIFTLHEDIGVPRVGQLNPQEIRIAATQVASVDDTALGSGSAPAQAVVLDGQDNPRKPTVISVFPGDMSPADGTQKIAAGARVTVTFSVRAGLSNPAEGGRFSWTVQNDRDADPVAAAHPDALVRQAFGETNEPETTDDLVTGLLVDLQVILSSDTAGRGAEIVAIGRGFKNDTTLTFWRDGNFNGVRDGGENALCVTQVGGDDIGACTFTVVSPPFVPGPGDCAISDGRPDAGVNCNLVNAVDGRGQSSTIVLEGDSAADAAAAQVLELDGLVRAEFSSGQRILIHLADYPPGSLAAVEIAGQPVDFPDESVGEGGVLTFSVATPPGLREGRQDLRVAVTRQDNGEIYAARATIIVGGPIVRATPRAVLPNQRIHLVGNDFSIAAANGEPVTIAAITIGGRAIDAQRIHGSTQGSANAIAVDSGGNWSASLDLPVNPATTTPGELEIEVRDSRGRAGTVTVTVAPRELTLTPIWGRAGSLVTVEGRHFPSRNDQGSGVNLRVIYDAGSSQTRTSAQTNTDGYFKAELRVPRNAAAPSTNQVRVEFRDDEGALVATVAAHDVPGAALTLSPAAGPPGTMITASAQGFRGFMPVQSVTVGNIEVTPAPRPATDAAGRVNLQILIPGLGLGQQNVELQINDITVSRNFTVTAAGVTGGAVTPADAALINLGNRFLRAFHFNNDTKTWTFYDPAAGDANTLENFIAGESYWLLVSETAAVVLKGKTRRLTCAAGNCWNLIVW